MSARLLGISLLIALTSGSVYAEDRQGTLENGLSYIVRQTSRPLGEAEFRLVVQAGELDVSSEKNQGAMHLIEHMAFRNTKDFPNGSLVPFLRSKGFRFGLHLNGATRPEVTTYQLSLSHAKSQDLEDGMNVLFNMAQNVNFESDTFAREKNVVAEEIRLHSDNPWVSAWENGLKLLLSNTNSGRWSFGTADSIKAIDEKEVTSLYQALYRANRMTVIVTGNIDTAAAEKALKKKFAAVRPDDKLAGAPYQRGPWPVPSGIFYAVNPLPDKFNNLISVSLVLPRSDFKTSAGDMQSYQYSLLRYILKQRLGGGIAMDWQFRADGQPMLNWVFETSLDWQKNKGKWPDHFKVLENFENRLAMLIAKPLDQETLDLFKQEYLGSVQQWYATSRNQAKTEAELLQNAAQGLHPWIDTAAEWPLVQAAIAQVDSQKISDMLSGMAKGPRYIQVMQESSHLKTLPSCQVSPVHKPVF